MVRLGDRPPQATSHAHLGRVGEGVMYDSGGIALKAADPPTPS
jgi:leucyl aminopeptidase